MPQRNCWTDSEPVPSTRSCPSGVLTSIVVQDGSALSAEHIALFGKLTDLEQLQILNFRSLNDEMAAQLGGTEATDDAWR